MKLWRRRGAILFDVLVGVFVLSVGILAVVGLFIQAGQAGKLLNQQEQAACLAQETMERVSNIGSEDWSADSLATLVGNETISVDGVVFERTIHFLPRPDLDTAGHLAEMEVQVLWQENGQPKRYCLLTYFAVDTGLENLR